MAPREQVSHPLARSGPRALALLLYPVAVWACLRLFDTRTAVGVIALLLVPLLVWNAVLSRGLRFPLVFQGAIVVVILATAFFTDNDVVLRAVPALIAASFTANFLVSLARGRPIVEVFARMHKERLSHEEVVYCRRATWYWVGVQAAVTVLVTAAIFLRQTWQWLVVAAPASYALIGLAFAAEYTYRRWRFREFDVSRPWDRLLLRVMGAGR
jgi:uncharacterized membrane protein